MKTTTTKRMMTLIIAFIFATSITSCKKENNIVPQTPVIAASPLIGSWLREVQVSSGKKEITIETIKADLTGEIVTKIIRTNDGGVTSTVIKKFNLQKLENGFIQNLELGPSISVNYSISIDNRTMIKDLEGGRQQTFTRQN